MKSVRILGMMVCLAGLAGCAAAPETQAERTAFEQHNPGYYGPYGAPSKGEFGDRSWGGLGGQSYNMGMPN